MPAKEQVEELAYALWEREGRPSNRDVAHYLEAERTLREREQAAEEARRPAARRDAPERPRSRRRRTDTTS